MNVVIVDSPVLRPGLKYECEVMSVKQGPEDLVPTAYVRILGGERPLPEFEELPPPDVATGAVMLYVAGKRFVCRCTCSVFTKVGDTYRCNACCQLYGEGDEG